MLNAELHDKVVRLKSRVYHLETDLPSASNFAKNLSWELDSSVDTALIECEGLDSRALKNKGALTMIKT